MLKQVAALFVLATLTMFGQASKTEITDFPPTMLAEKLLGPVHKDVPAGIDFMSTNRLIDYKEDGNVAALGVEIAHTDEITENEYFPPVNGKRDMKLRVIEITSGGFSGSRTFWFADPVNGKLIYYYPGFNCHQSAVRYEFRDSVSKRDKGTGSTMAWKCGGREVGLYTTPVARNSAFAKEVQDHFNTMVAKYYLPPDDWRFRRNNPVPQPKNGHQWLYAGLTVLALVTLFFIIKFRKRAGLASVTQ